LSIAWSLSQGILLAESVSVLLEWQSAAIIALQELILQTHLETFLLPDKCLWGAEEVGDGHK
jgi:hypothetical protein